MYLYSELSLSVREFNNKFLFGPLHIKLVLLYFPIATLQTVTVSDIRLWAGLIIMASSVKESGSPTIYGLFSWLLNFNKFLLSYILKGKVSQFSQSPHDSINLFEGKAFQAFCSSFSVWLLYISFYMTLTPNDIQVYRTPWLLIKGITTGNIILIDD